MSKDWKSKSKCLKKIREKQPKEKFAYLIEYYITYNIIKTHRNEKGNQRTLNW